MKSLTTLFAVLCFSIVLSPNAFGGDKEDASAAMEKAINAFSSKDYETFFTYLTDDFESFNGVVTPLLHIGKTSYVDFINGFRELPSVTYRQQQNTVRVYNGDTALLNGYFVFRVVNKDGSTTFQSGRNSTTLVKQNGKWLIANFHFSPMF